VTEIDKQTVSRTHTHTHTHAHTHTHTHMHIKAHLTREQEVNVHIVHRLV